MMHSDKKVLLLIGGSGFIGNAVGEYFARSGWKIRLLSRSADQLQTSFPCTQYQWNGKELAHHTLKSVSAIINLAGAGIADKAWTKNYRDIILRSRTESARAIVNAIVQSRIRIPVLIQVSAVGFYGSANRFEVCDEKSSSGHDFLAEVCKSWENEINPLSDYTRLVIARMGLVLGWEGGALPKLWDIYASGMGSRLGHGTQWMNWIHLEDVVRFFMAAIESEHAKGSYNLVAPGNIDNRTFHRYLASKTPSLHAAVAPGFAVRTMLGDRSELLLSAPEVVSERLSQIRFQFHHPDFSEALEQLLKERRCTESHYLKMKQWIPEEIRKIRDFITSADDSVKCHGIVLRSQSSVSESNSFIEFNGKQKKFLYKKWFYRYILSELRGGTLIEQRIEYRLAFFPVGELAFPFVRNHLKKSCLHQEHMISSEFPEQTRRDVRETRTDPSSG